MSKEYEEEGEPVTEKSSSHTLVDTKPKPFPFWPSQPSSEELKRMEVMMELNKWANNDPFMAKRSAETLILLLSEQFGISLLHLGK